MKNRNLLALVLIFGWVALVLVGYYIVHKPIDISLTVALTRSILDLAVVAVAISLAGGMGRKIVGDRWGHLHILERAALEGALGLGVLGLVWLLIGLLGGYFPVVGWLILIAGGVLFFREILAWVKDITALANIFKETGRFGRFLAYSIILLSFSKLLVALAPPLKWDALMYHLEIPRQYILNGHFTFLENNLYWGNPQLGTQLYTWAMLLRGYETATVLGWAIFALFSLGIMGMIVRLARPESAWVALAALFAGESIRGQMSWGYVDGLAALYGFCVIVLLIDFLKSSESRMVYWIGLFSGLALWSKLTSGVILLCVACVLLVYLGIWQFRTWKVIGVYSSIAIFVFLPWMGILAYHTGNPFFPYLIETEWVSKERLAYFSYDSFFAGRHILYLPLSMTWFGLETANVQSAPPYNSDIGPLLLMLGLPGLFYGVRHGLKDLTVAAIFTLCGLIFMLIGGTLRELLWQTRLYFGLLSAAAVAAGMGWQTICRVSLPGIRLRNVVGGALVLVLLLSCIQELRLQVEHHPARYLIGLETSEAYLNRSLGAYAEAMDMVRELPETAKVLFLWEPRGLYAPPNAIPDTWIDRWYLGRLSKASVGEIFRGWHEEGFTHVLLYQLGMEFERETRKNYTKEDWEALEEWLGHLSLKDFNGDYALYQLSN